VGSYLDLSALRDVLVVSLLAGLGSTLLFSRAVRSMVTADEHPQSATGQRLIATGLLLVVLAAVAVGLWAVLAK
jgi:hypothetical protein